MTTAQEEQDAPQVEELPPDKVRLGVRVFDLVPPSSFALAHDIISSAGKNNDRGFAAALFVCCDRLGRMFAKDGDPLTYAACDYDPLRLGGEVMDRLHKRKVPRRDVVIAGIKAFALVCDAFITDEEIRAAEGNSASPGA